MECLFLSRYVPILRSVCPNNTNCEKDPLHLHYNTHV
nr:MAG TPA: hypothetical protein [Caudoviricetes sp.]